MITIVQAEEGSRSFSLLSGQFLKPAFQQNSRDEKVGERSHQKERRIGEPRHRSEKEDKHPKVVPLEAVHGELLILAGIQGFRRLTHKCQPS